MYWQKIAVQALSVDQLWQWLGENIANQVPLAAHDLFAKTIQANIEFPHDASLWAKVFFHDKVEIAPEELQVIREAGEQFFVEAELAVIKYGIQLPLILDEMKKTLNVSGKKLFMPLRIALTGRKHGPELAHIAELLGSEKMQHRLGQAVQLANG